MPAPRKHPDPELGTKFGYGTVLALVTFKRTTNRQTWERGAVLGCDCGNEYLADLSALYRGSRKSCGCKRKKRGFVATPGYAGHALYYTWHGMMDRCYNPDVRNYRWYGGRGITVCCEWQGLDARSIGLTTPVGTSRVTCAGRQELNKKRTNACGGKTARQFDSAQRGGGRAWVTEAEFLTGVPALVFVSHMARRDDLSRLKSLRLAYC
jgi:hypothetical protein